MPFIYIDSQDREVKIPSVDALRLRIELGAIKDQTQFHDENTGRWAPAVEHDIFRTLKRELEALESSGFVAPPPPAPVPVADETAPREGSLDAPAAVATEAPEEPEEPGSLEPLTLDDPATVPGLPEDVVDAADPFAMDLGIAPSEPSSPAEAGPPSSSAQDTVEEEDDDGFDVGPLWDDEPDLGLEAGEDPARQATAMAHQEAEASEAPSPEPPETEPSDPQEERFVASAEEELLGSAPSSDGGMVEDSGLTLEPSLAESFDTDGASSAPQEDPDDVPSWMSPPDEIPSEPAGAAVDATDAADSWQAEEELPSMPVARPRTAPPPRKLTRARSPGAQGVAGLVLLVVVVAAAAVFGWGYVSPLLAGSDAPEPEIALPPLAEELMPRFEAMAGAAASGMAAAFLALPERTRIPGEPSQDWLAGIYLANARAYPNVPAYWGAVREWVDAARNAEMSAFREALQSEVDASDLPAAEAEAVRNRALSGFQAASTRRQVVYDQLRAVADRALSLHEFLLANEAQVDYEPAGSGVSRDPVLEAVPANGELGEAMWGRVGAITNALDALGYLDQIDTDRLLGAFLEKLEASAVR